MTDNPHIKPPSPQIKRDLRSLLEPVLQGCSHEDVIESLASLLSQAIADQAVLREEAVVTANTIGRAMAQDIRNNWSLVRARRARG